MGKGKKEEQKRILEKVIRLTIHDTQPGKWEVDRIELPPTQAAQDACRNLRRAVVQQDFCTGNERLLLLNYKAKNRTFVHGENPLGPRNP